MTKTRLILFAHGSRDKLWLDTFWKQARNLGMEFGHDRVALAFMEFARPTLLDVIAESRREGVLRVKVLPMFLSAGGHVSRDIPKMIAEAKLEFPEMEIRLLPPIGEHPSFQSMVGLVAKSALGGATNNGLTSYLA